MLKCPYCKETFYEMEIVCAVVEKYFVYYSEDVPNGSETNKYGQCSIYSCPKCKTVLNCE
jgi:hypothetical protein